MAAMEQFSTFVEVLLAIAAATVTLWAAIKAVREVRAMVRSPTTSLESKVTAMDMRISKHDQMLDNDNRRIAEQEESLKLLLGGMLQLLNHEIDGNHDAQLHDQRNEIEQFLVNR